MKSLIHSRTCSFIAIAHAGESDIPLVCSWPVRSSPSVLSPIIMWYPAMKCHPFSLGLLSSHGGLLDPILIPLKQSGLEPPLVILQDGLDQR